MAAGDAPPLVSIVVATWNAGRTLERLLKSTLAQDFSRWELVVADGGSSDDTVAILQRYSAHIAHWHSQPDQGIYDAWNQAIAHARGRYICFLGADDAWCESHSLSLVATVAEDGDFDLVSSRGRIVDGQGHVIATFGNPWDYQRLGRRMVVCHPGLLHHRRLFDLHGQFNSAFRIAGDLEFLLRLGPSTTAAHVPVETVLIENAGISRSQVLRRLREQRRALAACPRYGPFRAHLVWLDKLLRYPIARLFGISH